jgi:type IV pilus assembly protein PilQ
MIEARIVEANDSFNRDLGMKLNLINSKANQIGGTGVSAVGGKYAPGTSTLTLKDGVWTQSGTAAVLTQTPMAGVNLPSFTSTGGTLALSLFNSSLTRILNLEIAALESDGVGKVISSPRVITANNVKAKIEDGTEVPYVTTQSTAGSITQTVSFKPAKLSLEVTPQITPEGTVKMDLIVKKEEPDWTRAIFENPPIKSSVVETNVVVENGGTVVIGGSHQEQRRQPEEDEEAAGVGQRGDHHRAADGRILAEFRARISGMPTPAEAASSRLSVIAAVITMPSATLP